MARAILAVLFLGFVSLALSHSFLECADWRLNDPSKPSWLDSAGTCHGYPRRFPVGMNRAYGEYDNIEYYRHFDQGANPDTKPPCNPRIESRANPVSKAYGPNKDALGYTTGAMPSVPAGGQMCWTWPAKNHQHEDAKQYVMVNWAPQAGVDPTQAVFSQHTVAQLLFKNCSRYPGLTYGTSYSNTKPADNNQPCGGCFKVPNRAPGIYSVQYRWQLDVGEVYTSCVDVEVTAANDNTPPPEETMEIGQDTTEPTMVTNEGTPTTAQNMIQTSTAAIQSPADLQADAHGLAVSFTALLTFVMMLV
jgi:hypothetical protein